MIIQLILIGILLLVIYLVLRSLSKAIRLSRMQKSLIKECKENEQKLNQQLETISFLLNDREPNEQKSD